MTLHPPSFSCDTPPILFFLLLFLPCTGETAMPVRKRVESHTKKISGFECGEGAQESDKG